MQQEAINLGYTKEVLSDGKIYYVKGEGPVICLSVGRNTYGLDVWEIYVKIYSLHVAEKQRLRVNQLKDADYVKNIPTEELETISKGKYSTNAVKRELVKRFFDEKKYEKAYPLCIDLVNERDNFSCKYWEYLGFMYVGGLGIEKDPGEAVVCFNHAWSQGCISPKGELCYYDLQLKGYYPDYVPNVENLYRSLIKYYEKLAKVLPEAKDRIPILNKKIKEEESKRNRKYNSNNRSGNRGNSKGSLWDLFK